MADVPMLDYRAASKDRRPAWRSPAVWLTVVGIIAVLVSIILQMRARMREQCCSVPCAANLRSIGQGIALYARDNGGVFPPDLAAVLLTQEITPKVFVCPSSSDTPAQGSTAQQQAAQLLNDHCSYIYVGQHFTYRDGESPNPTQVVAFEDPGIHDLEGCNIVFHDGHVEFCNIGYAALLVSELEQGYNPPRDRVMTRAEYRAMYQRDWVPKLVAMKSGQWSARLPAPRPTTLPTTVPSGSQQ